MQKKYKFTGGKDTEKANAKKKIALQIIMHLIWNKIDIAKAVQIKRYCKYKITEKKITEICKWTKLSSHKW